MSSFLSEAFSVVSGRQSLLKYFSTANITKITERRFLFNPCNFAPLQPSLEQWQYIELVKDEKASLKQPWPLSGVSVLGR